MIIGSAAGPWKHRLGCVLSWCLLAVVVGCSDGPSVDLRGPRILASSLRHVRMVEVSVRPTFELQFSEPLAAESIHSGSVALVAWNEVGRCDRTDRCETGSCERGRCQEDPLSQADLSRIDRGRWQAEIPLRLELGTCARGPRSRLRIEPRRALLHHARHALVVGSGVRDESGAGLQTGRRNTRWRRDFVTARRGSGGPEAELLRPTPGQTDVPTNVARIWTRFALPVRMEDDAHLRLEAEHGPGVRLVDPRPCDGWVRGHCLTWRPQQPLRPSVRYRPAAGTLRDRWGRAAVLPHAPAWFASGVGRDEQAPEQDAIRAELLGPCVIARHGGPGIVTLSVSIDGAIDRAHGLHAMAGVRVAKWGGNGLLATIKAEDLAGNRTRVERMVDLPENPGPALVITELLANPFGDEPDQEFVEVVALKPVDVAAGELWIADMTWPEVVSAVRGGSRPGDALPRVQMPAGGIAVIVEPDHRSGASSDPPIAEGATVLRVDSSVGRSGLKNAGEPVVLYRAEPLRLISSYGNFVATGGRRHEGRSVTRANVRACDVPRRWRAHPLGRSTPGRLP